MMAITSLILHKLASYLEPKMTIRLAHCCRLFARELYDYMSSINDWCLCKINYSLFLSQLMTLRVQKVMQMEIYEQEYECMFFIDDLDTEYKLPHLHVKSCEIVLMTHNKRKIHDIIAQFVTLYALEAISIEPYDHEYKYVLTDEHIKPLQGVKHVRLNGNKLLTDKCLHHLRLAEIIEIRGCRNISGASIPRLLLDPTTKLFGILWFFGYGDNRHMPFNLNLNREWVIHQSTRVGIFISDFHICHRTRNSNRCFVVPFSTSELAIRGVDQDGCIVERYAQDIV